MIKISNRIITRVITVKYSIASPPNLIRGQMPSEGQRANRLPFRSVLFQGNYNIFRQFFQHIKVQKRKNGMRKTHTVFM